VIISPDLFGQGIERTHDLDRVSTAHDARTSCEQQVTGQSGDVIEFMHTLANLEFVQKIEQGAVTEQQIGEVTGLLI
jgi:hypothetical protein